ncbi:MAG: Ig-like domain-containing protein [Paludibacter sp.]
MKKLLLLICISVSIFGLSAQTLGKTLLFDFGPNDVTNGNITSNPDVNGNYWNNIIDPSASATVSGLLTNTNTATSYALKIVTKFSTNGLLSGGLTAPEASKIGIFAIPTVTQDYFYTSTSGSFKLTGLTKTKAYKFYFFNSRSTADPARISQFNLVGLTTAAGTLQSSGTNLGGTGYNGNKTTILETSLIYPDANAEINITLTPFSGGYAYINGLKVEEYTVPYVSTTSITVSGNDIPNTGGQSQMKATVLPADATPNSFNWSVSDATVASIDANGLLSAKKNGTVTVTASITQSGVVLSGQKQITVSNQLSALYLSGTATSNGDNISTAILLNTPPDKIGLNTGIFETGTTLNNTGTFNFYSSQNAGTATVFGAGSKADTLIVGASPIPSTISGSAVVRAYLGTNSYKLYPNSPFKISQMGSSVSNGQGASVTVTNSLGSTSYIGYAYKYGQLLNQRFTSGTSQNNWVLSNISIGGNDTKDVLARWDKDLLNDGSLYVVYALSLGNEGIITGGQAIYDQFKTNMLMLIAKARSVGKIPIIANVYPRADFGLTEYNYVKQIDMLIHEWDVPSFNLLGCIDDGTGKWPLLYQHDNSHPNDDGHTELSYSIVPTLFDALNAGKAQPVKQSGTYLSLNKTTANHQLAFTPDNTFHSFTTSVDFKTTGTGSILSFPQGAVDGIVSIDATTGFLTYQSPNGGFITGTTIINDGQWHNATLSHYYAQGFTVLYCDGVAVNTINEKLLAIAFNLFDSNAPTSVDYRNWFFYRSGMNQMEITGLTSGKMLKSSLELYAPLDGQAILGSNQLVNLAQSLNTIQLIDNSKTSQTITFAAIPTKVPGDADFSVVATASSGLAVTLTSSNTAVATIVNGNIHIVGAGISVITASQAGDDTYKSAISVRQTLTVNGTNQTITFPALSAKVYGDADYSPGASASSGLTVTYSSSNTYVATIVNGNIHLVGPGTATITASQAGNAIYNAAPDVSQSLKVTSIIPTTGLYNEVFDYTLGPLNGQGSWTEAGTITTGTGTRTITSGALTYSDEYGTYILSALGKSMTISLLSGTTVSDFKAYKPFSATSISSGVLYLSFLLKVNASVSSTNQEAFGMADGTSAGPKVVIGKTTTGFYKLGTVRGATTSADYKYAASPTSLTVGATNLIVLKYDFSSSTSSIYINPKLGDSEPSSPEISDNTSTTIRTKLSNLWSRAQGTVTQNLTIGGVRVSNTWADAVEKVTITSISTRTLNTSQLSLRVVDKTILASETGTFRIYNLQGLLLLRVKNTNKLITDLNTGLYIVCFSNENGQEVSQKIIIH